MSKRLEEMGLSPEEEAYIRLVMEVYSAAPSHTTEEKLAELLLDVVSERYGLEASEALEQRRVGEPLAPVGLPLENRDIAASFGEKEGGGAS